MNGANDSGLSSALSERKRISSFVCKVKSSIMIPLMIILLLSDIVNIFLLLLAKTFVQPSTKRYEHVACNHAGPCSSTALDCTCAVHAGFCESYCACPK